MYTTTINQNGMVLLNKDARKALGLKLGDKVMVNFDKKNVRIEPRMSEKEAQAYMDSLFTPESKKLVKKYAGKTADELFEIAMKKSMAGEIAEGRL